MVRLRRVNKKDSEEELMSRAHSNKAKGRVGQQEVQQLLLDYFEELEFDDCRSNPMGAGGEDILLSPFARRVLNNIQIEVKRKKKIGACRFMEQAEEHGKFIPTAFFREDRGEWYTCVPSSFFLKLLRSMKHD